METFKLYEYFFDDEGRFLSRTHDAWLVAAERPSRDEFWFQRPGSRASVTRENLDKARYARYYSLTDDPGTAYDAILASLEQKHSLLLFQASQVRDTIDTILAAGPKSEAIRTVPAGKDVPKDALKAAARVLGDIAEDKHVSTRDLAAAAPAIEAVSGLLDQSKKQ